MTLMHLEIFRGGKLYQKNVKEAKMGWDHMNWGWGGGIMMIFWIGLITAVIYWLIRSVQRNNNDGSRYETAIDILKKRYARGEISKEEFEQRKKDLL